MCVKLSDSLPNEDNFILLDQACLLLRAVDDILVNDSCEIYHLAYACEDEAIRKGALCSLGLLYSGVSRATKILQTLCKSDRASWNP